MNVLERLRAFEPAVLAQLAHPALAWAKPWVVKRRLLRFTMHGTALGVAFGFLAGAIPGPMQVISALVLCLLFRANVVAAVAASFWTNPLSIVPVYLLAHAIGRAVIPGDNAVPSISGFSDLSAGGWFADMAIWVGQLGQPLLVGLPILAGALALVSYLLVRLLWPAAASMTRRRSSKYPKLR